MTHLKSKGQQIVVDSVNKIDLCCFDDKLYILDDTVSSLACGPYSLTVSQQEPSESEKSNVKVKHFIFLFLDWKISFVADNESHTKSDSSGEAFDENCIDTDDVNADH